MNKKEILELLKKLDLPKDEYYILSGCSMLFYGLREDATDLDLCVSNDLFEKLKERYKINESDKNETGFYHISKNVEIVPNKKENFKVKYKDGYPVEDLETILKYKENRKEMKDLKDIEKIKKYLEEKEIDPR